MNRLTMFGETHRFVFAMGVAIFVMLMTNCIVNVTAIASACDSQQFTGGEFIAFAALASAILMVVTAPAVSVIRPLLGMPVITGAGRCCDGR